MMKPDGIQSLLACVYVAYSSKAVPVSHAFLGSRAPEGTHQPAMERLGTWAFGYGH